MTIPLKEGLDHAFYIKSKDVQDHVQMKYQKLIMPKLLKNVQIF